MPHRILSCQCRPSNEALKRVRILLHFSALLWLLGSLSLTTWLTRDASAAEERPNFIILYADDLGYGDLGCYGHPSIRTPHLDRMAKEGMRFTDFYSTAEVCTPSRAALLTGRYPIRNGMCHERFRVLRRNSAGGLPLEEVTLAEVLKEQGYATACIGKWHLGVLPEYRAHRQGFDSFFGLPHSNDMDPNPGNPPRATARLDQNPAWWNSPLYRNDEIIEQPADQTTLTKRYTAEAIQFIRAHQEQPFFLYLPHSFPHVPLFTSEEQKGKSPRGVYGDVVEELDANAGAILDTLRETGLDKRTLVVFSSDNGPWLIMDKAGGSAGLLRDGKGSTYEGGMRVPCIAWWPGKIPAGNVTRELACTMDLYTTMATLAGGKVPTDRIVDGLNITPVLTGEGKSPREFFCYYRGDKLFAARLGPWKAHFITQGAYGPPPRTEHELPELYHLGDDPAEKFNVAKDHPDVVDAIRKLVAEHQSKVVAAPSQLEATIP